MEYRGCGRDLGVLSALARLLVVVERAVGMVVQAIVLDESSPALGKYPTD